MAMTQMQQHGTGQDEPQREAAKRKDFNTAVWFFVGAVFVAVSPTLGESLNISVSPVITWSAAALLTIVGFWLIFRRA
ncbi:hypothetical protein [Micrococcoides hystricis]|uniref:Uncharacterized protein n=1 Tax=Micrococcoides hystricis TaxID=1572761 RepID=A0ABV6P7R6_9MICC